jgi:multidrug efflux pump subunit AcrA (membrane-fusion protein)
MSSAPAVSLLLSLVACGLSLGSDIPTAEATEGEFLVVLSVHGELDAVNSESISTPVFNSRPEIAWMVDEGSRVKQGDRILSFDTEAMEKGLSSARSELLLAQTKIEQNTAKLRLKVSDAEADITRAELDLQVAKMQRTDSETVPLVDRENARVNETKSALAIDSARSALATTRLESRADTQLLQLEVQERTRLVETLEKQLEQADVMAPTDGLVLIEDNWQGKWKVGSRPWTGAMLLRVPDLSSMKVVATVHEVDSPEIAVDQPATITIDAYPDIRFAGSVAKVADLAVARGEDEVKYLEFEVALDESTPQMKPGMTVRVDLQLSSSPDKVSIPIEAVRHAEDQAYVWVDGLTGWGRQDITTTLENDTHVVVEGLDAGSIVALVDPHAWSEEEGSPAADDAS